jgi:putative oxidoreductase
MASTDHVISSATRATPQYHPTNLGVARTNHALVLVGRIAIAALFIWSGLGKLMGGLEGTAGYIASQGLPMPMVLAALTVALELGGGLLLALGWKARWVAILLALWLIPTTLIFHRFWGDVPAAQVMSQQINFYKNVAIFGGMLLLAGFGPGRFSIDRS